MSCLETPPVWIEDVGPNIFALRWTDLAGEVLGLDRNTEVRIHAGPGGRDAALAHAGILCRQFAEETSAGRA